jgi:hypothetical protein
MSRLFTEADVFSADLVTVRGLTYASHDYDVIRQADRLEIEYTATGQREGKTTSIRVRASDFTAGHPVKRTVVTLRDDAGNASTWRIRGVYLDPTGVLIKIDLAEQYAEN